MGTNSYIGYYEDGVTTYVYCASDSYLEWVGYKLLSKYNDIGKIKQLVGMGSIYHLDDSIEMVDGLSFYNTIDGYSVFFHRDRGDELVIKRGSELKECLMDYIYIFKEGRWYYNRGKGRFKLLKMIN